MKLFPAPGGKNLEDVAASLAASAKLKTPSAEKAYVADLLAANKHLKPTEPLAKGTPLLLPADLPTGSASSSLPHIDEALAFATIIREALPDLSATLQEQVQDNSDRELVALREVYSRSRVAHSQDEAPESRKTKRSLSPAAALSKPGPIHGDDSAKVLSAFAAVRKHDRLELLKTSKSALGELSESLTDFLKVHQRAP